MSNQDIKIRILAQDKSKQALSGVRNSLGRVKDAALSVQGALLGIGAGAALKSIITTAAEVESLQVRLKFLTGSTKDAGIAFKVMNEYASSVPFALADIERASPSLLTVADNVEDLNELLQITGDIAAVSGLSFDETAMQIQRAFAGGIASADQFRERGVSAFLGFEAGVSYSADKTRNKIISMWRDGTTTAKGATDELADTFTGQVSMMQDAWRELKLVVADTGVFSEASNVIRGITEGLRDPAFKDGVKVFSEKLLELFRFSVDHKDELLAIGSAFLGGKIGGIFGKQGKALGAAAGGIVAYQDSLAQLLGMQVKTGTLDSVEEINAAILETYNSIIELNEKFTSGGFETILDKIFPEVDGFTFGQNAYNMQRQALQKQYDELLELRKNFGEHVIDITSGLPQETDPFAESLAALTKEAEALDLAFESLEALNDEANFQEYLTNLEAVAAQISAMREANHQAANAIKSDWQKIGESITSAWETVSDSIENTLADAVLGLSSWRDATKMILQEVAREFVKTYMIKGMVTNISTGLGNLFGLEPRANGGAVTAGQSYLVGERGAEVFVPTESGTIIPNEQINNTSNINVNFNITANDTRGFDQLLQQRRGQIVGMVNQALNDRGMRAIA
jgi:phage tail tape-measure protein